jgi:hypothetical protein
MVMLFALFLESLVTEIPASLAKEVKEPCWVIVLAWEVLGAFGAMAALAGQKKLGMQRI